MIDKVEPNNCYNLDCEIGMRLMIEQGLKADWCIADPPYGIGAVEFRVQSNGTQYGNSQAKCRTYEAKEWDNKRIGGGCIQLMKNASTEQIIFGGNYYTDILPPTKSWIVWDKRGDNRIHLDFADCELAWCSTGLARVFRYMYNGMLQDDMKSKDYRFHPTQKPTQLWYMLLNYYTKEGDLILDPFAGSQSLRIACHKLKRNYIGFELDKDYWEQGTKWFNEVSAQMSIFDL